MLYFGRFSINKGKPHLGACFFSKSGLDKFTAGPPPISLTPYATTTYGNFRNFIVSATLLPPQLPCACDWIAMLCRFSSLHIAPMHAASDFCVQRRDPPFRGVWYLPQPLCGGVTTKLDSSPLCTQQARFCNFALDSPCPLWYNKGVYKVILTNRPDNHSKGKYEHSTKYNRWTHCIV